MKTFTLASLLFLLAPLSACHSPFDLSARLPSVDPFARKATVTISTTAKSLAELPLCDRSAIGVAGFIESSNTYHKCDGARWRSVKPGGFEGRFLPRESVRFHEWQDLKAGSIWSSPVANPVAATKADASCPKDRRLPSEAEVKLAAQNGLIEGMRAHGGRVFSEIWTSGTGEGRKAYAFSTSGPSKTAETAGVYCVGFSRSH